MFTYYVSFRSFAPEGTSRCDVVSSQTAPGEASTTRNHQRTPSPPKEWRPHRIGAVHAVPAPRQVAWPPGLGRAAEAAAGSRSRGPGRMRKAAEAARPECLRPSQHRPHPHQCLTGLQEESTPPTDSSHLEKVRVSASANTKCFPKPATQKEAHSRTTGTLAYTPRGTHMYTHRSM